MGGTFLITSQQRYHLLMTHSLSSSVRGRAAYERRQIKSVYVIYQFI